MFRLLKELSRGVLSIQAMRVAKMAPQPRVLAMTIHTGPPCKESENVRVADSKVYVNGNRHSVCYLDFLSLPLAYCPIQLLMQ